MAPAGGPAEPRQTGEQTAEALGRLTPAELDRQWDHPIFGTMPIERTAGIIARHLRAHAAELGAALHG